MSFVPFRASDIEIKSNNPSWNGNLDEMKNTFHFRPHFGWLGAIEKQRTALPA
jgi:hypothetical protein